MIIVKNFLSAVVGVSCTFMLVNTMIINKESKAMQGYSTLVYNRPFFFFLIQGDLLEGSYSC